MGWAGRSGGTHVNRTAAEREEDLEEKAGGQNEACIRINILNGIGLYPDSESFTGGRRTQSICLELEINNVVLS